MITLDRVLIDHLVYAVPSRPEAIADVAERFGVQPRAGGKHVGLGTHNALLALGPRTYLEIIAPDPDQPEPPARRPFGLARVTHGRLAGWALACDDIDAAVAGARSHGYDPGDVTDGRRVGPTGTALRWRMTRSQTAGGLVPFLISWGNTEHPARSAPRGLTLEACYIEHPDRRPRRGRWYAGSAARRPAACRAGGGGPPDTWSADASRRW